MALYRQMWFGTRERMTAVRAPKVDYDASKAGWDGGVTQFLNGGAYVRRSVTSHKLYNMTWTNLSRDEIREINDYADGVHGNGAIYFIDPFAMDKNLLPQYWATPRLALSDAPMLNGGSRFSAIAYPQTLINSLGYPTTAMQYTINNDSAPVEQRPTVYIPIPEGYTLWFGAHGVAQDASASPLTITTDSEGIVQVPISGIEDNQRFSISYEGGINPGVTISLGANGTGIISGMMVQVLPTGVLPTTGGFISGQGHGGVRFATNPTLQQYSAVMDMVSLTAQFVEDETWR